MELLRGLRRGLSAGVGSAGHAETSSSSAAEALREAAGGCGRLLGLRDERAAPSTRRSSRLSKTSASQAGA